MNFVLVFGIDLSSTYCISCILIIPITAVNADAAGLIKRPIYNVAHMVNGNDQINEEWVDETNALESDLMFNSDGSPKEFYHGFPCDCGRWCWHRNQVITQFETIRRKAQDESQNFALFWIDMKLTNSDITDFFSSGQKLAKEITKTGSLSHLVR